MAALSSFLETKILNLSLRNTAYTPPTTVYVALYTSNPGAADTGTEVAGGSYARPAATWSAPSSGVSSNVGDLTYTNMPACTVTHVGIRDASTSGNLLYYGPLAVSKVINSGDTFVIHASDLAVQVA